MNSVKNLCLFLILLIFSGCLPKQEDVKNIFQTNAASVIKRDYLITQKHLLRFKKKIDKRNPKSYDKNISNKIVQLINNKDKSFLLKYNDMTLTNYKDYLQIAFSKDIVPNRNDYLILGLYYLFYSSYNVEEGHKVSAFLYEKEKLHNLYKNLQIIKWKIKVDRDIKNKYLFLTWQNNWQLELEKKIQKDEELTYSDLMNLEYIKNEKESLLDHSNFSFEVLLTQMIDRVGNSLEFLGEEPKDLTIATLRAMFIFL